MDKPMTTPPTDVSQVVAPARDIDGQIAQQDRTIASLRQRIAVAAVRRPRFSFRALYNELALEGELSAARETRGALLHDQLVDKARH